MLIPQRFHDAHENHVQQYNQLPKSRPMGLGIDLFARRKDGSEFEVEISLGHYQTDAGKYVRSVGNKKRRPDYPKKSFSLEVAIIPHQVIEK